MDNEDILQTIEDSIIGLETIISESDFNKNRLTEMVESLNEMKTEIEQTISLSPIDNEMDY